MQNQNMQNNTPDFHDTSIFAKNLQDALKKSNFTQEEFAEKINITVNALKLMLNGTNYPSIPTLVQICKVLPAEPDELFAGYLPDGISESDDPFYGILDSMEIMSPQKREAFLSMISLIVRARK